ncbi:hypothetical protein GCM10022408_26800 [Hymenobacter fastidiosus]|uniref:Uncharacterized protein n=1 Tax=Hymenobacter fastidiosus TaxID=486264 RepID=A0ABP7SJK3_9BACT
MDPRPKPAAHPTPTGPATKSTVDDQPAPSPAPRPTDQPAQVPSGDAPTPSASPADPGSPPVSPAPSQQEAADGEEALTDPAVTIQPDTSGDTDPGASSTNDAHPL